MRIDDASDIGGNGLAFVVLFVVWTGMALAARAHAKLPPRVLRIAATVTAAVTAALLAWAFWNQPRPQPSDLAQVWAGSRALVHRNNPYEIVGPGRPFSWPFPLLYPLPAIMALLPLSWLPMRWVDPIFVGISFALFTWAITARRLFTPTLAALVSLAALMTVQTSQWSVLMTGAALIPGIGFLLVAKPTIGLALFAAFPHWKTAVGCGAMLILCFVVWPGWLTAWRATLASAPHVVAPITRTGGFLLLLAILKWRRADARLLLALSCVPHTTAPYETIPLFLIPETWLQALSLWALGLLAYAGQWLTGPYASQAEYWEAGARWIVALMYLPCLVMVLRRPNVWSTAR